MTGAESPATPLAGYHIGITRPPRQAGELAGRLTALGARVTLLPVIAIEPLADPAALDHAIAELGSYDWLVFTSVNGVLAFGARLAALGHGWDAHGRARVAAIGPATARALARVGVEAAVIPDEYVAEALVEALGNVAGQRILLPRADIAREALARQLALRGAEVSEIAAYRTVTRPLPAEVVARVVGHDRPDAITLTSSSTVRGLVESLAGAGREPAEALAGVALIAIGPVTARALTDRGLTVAATAAEYTIPGLMRALLAYCAEHPRAAKEREV